MRYLLRIALLMALLTVFVRAEDGGRLRLEVDREFLQALVQGVLDLGKGLLVLVGALKASLHGKEAVQHIRNRRRRKA